MPARTKSALPKDSSANLGFEATALRGSATGSRKATLRSSEGNRWLAADKLRNNMDAAESYHDTAMPKGPGGVLGRKGNGICRAHFITEDWLHDTTLWGTDFKGNDPKFDFYFSRQQFTRLQSMNVGSANRTLNRNHVHPIAVNWPRLAEQKAIAAVLGALDDKIELNRRMNATLEAMARALFQSWFVDFDPVRAKLDGAAGGTGRAAPVDQPSGSGHPDAGSGHADGGLGHAGGGSGHAGGGSGHADGGSGHAGGGSGHADGGSGHADGGSGHADGGSGHAGGGSGHAGGWSGHAGGGSGEIVSGFRSEGSLIFSELSGIRSENTLSAPPTAGGGLVSAAAGLFPDSFQDSPLGPIPAGWEVRSLDKTAHYLNGLALQKYPPGDSPTLPFIKIAQHRKGDSVGADRCNTDLPANYIVQDGDVLFSWSGSLEVELWCGGPGALNQHLFKVTSPEFPKWFYYLWTLYHLDEFRLIAADKATTMGHIQRGHLTAAKVLIPPRPLLDAMTRTMSPLIDQLIANRIQSRTLATLRDTLLPKLLSGELQIPASITGSASAKFPSRVTV